MIRSFTQQRASFLSVLALCLGTLSLVGCGVIGGDQSHPAVVVGPAAAQVRAGDTQQFTATVSGVSQSSASPTEPAPLPTPHGPMPRTVDGDSAPMQPAGLMAGKPTAGGSAATSSAVTWAVNGVTGGNATIGTISTSGLYTAPAVLPGSLAIKVTATSTLNTLVSGDAMVSLENPVPVIQGAQPNPVTVGSFTLSVTGAKFVQGAQVMLNGTALQTTYVSGGALTATGTATVAQEGKVTITVKNPDPGSIASITSYSLQIDPPLTVGVTVSPATAQVRDGGSQQFTAAVTGTSNTALTWAVNGVTGGNSSTGTVNASGFYTAPATQPNPNTVTVTATSVADSRASGSATTTLEFPVPTLATLSPSTVNVGNFTLTVTGANFVSGAAVVFGGQMLTTTFVNGTQLTATGTATSTQVGQVAVVVANPDPGSADSNSVNEQVSAAGEQVTAAVASRFLEQASWGPTATTIAQVQQSGLQGYLTQQFSAPISTYAEPSATGGLTAVQQNFFVNAMQGQDQLRQRVSFALSEIMVVSAIKIGDPTSFPLWMNMLQNDAFSNFSTLLNDVTLSPTMGYYLDMGNNDGCSGCEPNENYGRESLQLFTIGLAMLNPDGTQQLDGSGNPIPTYTQATVDGFSAAFTGWSYPPAPGSQAQFYANAYFSGPMLPYSAHHNTGAKTLLNGVTLPAGGSIQSDLTAALQNIFTHPNVGPFICQQLIQKLVTSNPSPAYVGRISAVFADNGSGVRGDLQAVVSAILLDPEARRGDDPTQVQASDGHLREPLLHIMTMLRAVNATTDGANLMYYANNMKQEPFESGSVFNFYPPNYQIPGTQLLGPEFKLLNDSTTVARINFVNDLMFGSVGSTTTTNLSPYVAVAGNISNLLNLISLNMMHGQMSSDMQNTITTALSSISDPTQRTQTALYLTGGSSQFQVEH